MTEQIEALKEELAATKLLLRIEMERSDEAIEIAKFSLDALHKFNNRLIIVNNKSKMIIKA